MSIAIEFLNEPQVLLLRVYPEWKATERRAAVRNVKVHGCYRLGIPILIDSTQVPREVLPDMGPLRAALAAAFRDSRIAVVVSPAITEFREPVPLLQGVFDSRAEALHWLLR